MQLAFCSNAFKAGYIYIPQQGQSVTMQQLESVHKCALELALEAQDPLEVFAQQMNPGRLLLILQLMGKRASQIVTATTMQFIPGQQLLPGVVAPWS